jgi:hypothetical protein
MKSSKVQAGRPRGCKPCPHIEIPGDTLIPKSEAASELGVNVRTITRMNPASTRIGGRCYVAIGALRKQLADGLSSSKRTRRHG